MKINVATVDENIFLMPSPPCPKCHRVDTVWDEDEHGNDNSKAVCNSCGNEHDVSPRWGHFLIECRRNRVYLSNVQLKTVDKICSALDELLPGGGKSLLLKLFLRFDH